MTIIKSDPLVENNPQIDPAVKSRHRLTRHTSSKAITAKNPDPAFLLGLAIGALVLTVGLLILKTS
jgi:hypothetical protein